MRYQIVESSYPDDLTNSVNHYLKKGWEPLGGVSVTVKDVVGMNRLKYVQAMVLDDRPLEDKVT